MTITVPVSAAAPFEAGDQGSTRAPLIWWRSEAMIGAVTATVLPAVLALLVYYNVLDAQGATLWGAIATSIAGALAAYGRINGGAQPSPIARNLINAPPPQPKGMVG